MSRRNNRFARLTWKDLIAALESIQNERSMQEGGMTFDEVTDLIQAQLFRDQPLLAMRAARVVEIRCTDPGTVIYLRTGIPIGSEAATIDAGAFLPAVRILDGADGACRFIRQPRVKRGDNWRQNLRRRLRKSLREVETRSSTQSLVEFMTPENDDLETDLILQRFTQSPKSEIEPKPELQMDQAVLIGTSHWEEFKAAGISLPVWMSAITSLALVLFLLLSSPRG